MALKHLVFALAVAAASAVAPFPRGSTEAVGDTFEMGKAVAKNDATLGASEPADVDEAVHLEAVYIAHPLPMFRRKKTQPHGPGNPPSYSRPVRPPLPERPHRALVM